MIDLAILRAQVELGASPGRIVDLVEQMLAGETEQGDGSPLDWDSLKLIQTLGPDLDRKREKTRLATSITIDNPGSGYPPGGYGFSPAKGGSDA